MTNSMAQMPDRESARSSQPIRSALVLVFRVLLLGVGGLTAGLLGVVVAQFHPAPAQPVAKPPLLEQILRRSDALLKTVRHSSDARSPNANAANLPLPASPSLTSPQLTPAQRQQLQTELMTLKSQMTALGNRTAKLEVKLGADRESPAPLETRLQTLEQQLQPSTTSSPSAAPATPLPSTATDTLKVTLPSDTLFAADQTSLLPNSKALLGTVINELQRYPGATIRVAAYTDAQTGAAPARTRSLAQAEAIEQYLAQALGNQYHWMAIGYGQSHPLAANDTAVNRQRNRRIEIGIDPR